MPIYEFACPACRKTIRFLARRPVADANPPCPHCGGPLRRDVERFLAAPKASEADALGAGASDPARAAAALAAHRAALEGAERMDTAALLPDAAPAGAPGFAAGDLM